MNDPAATAMTNRERETLSGLIRQRERVAKASAVARSAEMLALFEAQLDRVYHAAEDPVWAAAERMAALAVAEAKTVVAAQCKALGIPAQFAPGIDVHWYGRGRNAAAKERAELRRLAERRIEQIETAARLEIARASVQAQEQVALGGFTTEAARVALANLPTVEALMPALAIAEMLQQLASPSALRSTALTDGGGDD
jgi:hypothetical protein